MSKKPRIKQVPVLVACDRQGNIIDGVLTRLSGDELYRHLNGCIKPGRNPV
ncbi:hypothetical protein GLP25_17990 [Photobacterium phosphoreum]|uniref:hypothetical protein n=1 Tax=Photobacterium phosphoreum TaxID=659 RepID=UPI001E34644E|nr:hypothetical protein [Photobacterium phosphoreum]MCD9485058.1 hypothetical protein [Photobacterium phosphoreum]